MSEVVKNFTSKFSFEVDHAPLEKMEKQLEAIKGRLEFLAAAEIVKGIFELGEKFAHFAEELHAASESAGITVEAFQKLAFAASQSAVSQEEMGGAMTRLSRKLYAARQGSEEAQKAFQQVGISPQQVMGFKNSGDAMLAVADRMHGMTDKIQKAALTTELFGRGSSKMVGFLSKGGDAIKGMGNEAEKLGIIMSEKQVAALVHLEQSLMKVFQIFKMIGATIATYIAPIIESAIKNFTDFYQANHKVLNLNIKAWAETLAYALGFIHGLVQGLIEVFLEFAATHQTLIRRVFEFATILGVLVGAIWAAQKVVGIFSSALGVLKSAFDAVMWVVGLLTSPIGLLIVAIGLMVVAIHDLWEVAHGRPGWINQFIEWLGIGKQVEAVFDAIFTAMEDIMNLDFGKLFKDVLGDVINVKDTLVGLFEKGSKWLGLGGEDKKGNEKIPFEGAVNAVKNLGHAAEGSTALQNLNAVPDLGTTPTFGVESKNGSGDQFNSVEAPVTINVSGAGNPKEVAEHIGAHIERHFDTQMRRADQASKSAEHY
jgi:hypothetical protein